MKEIISPSKFDGITYKAKCGHCEAEFLYSYSDVIIGNDYDNPLEPPAFGGSPSVQLPTKYKQKYTTNCPSCKCEVAHGAEANLSDKIKLFSDRLRIFSANLNLSIEQFEVGNKCKVIVELDNSGKIKLSLAIDVATL